jgi:hypothetical protein
MMTHVVIIRYEPLEKEEGDLVPIMGRKSHSQKAIRALSRLAHHLPATGL